MTGRERSPGRSVIPDLESHSLAARSQGSQPLSVCSHPSVPAPAARRGTDSPRSGRGASWLRLPCRTFRPRLLSRSTCRGRGSAPCGANCVACWNASGDRLRRIRRGNSVRRTRVRVSGPRCVRESGRRSTPPAPSSPSARSGSPSRAKTRRNRAAKALCQRQSRTCDRDRAILPELRHGRERKHPFASLCAGDPREDASLAEFLLRRLRPATHPGALVTIGSA